MKKILVIGGINSDSKETSSLADIADYVKQAVGQSVGDVGVGSCHIDQIGFAVSNTDQKVINLADGSDVADNDLIFFRGKMQPSINQVAIVAEYLKQKGVKFVASAYGDRRAVGKIAQMYQYANLGCPIPKTVSATNSHLQQLIDEYLEYPLILKAVNGSHGRDNYLVKSEQELQTILADNKSVSFMAQEFIKNEGDFRILIIGDDQLIIHRLAQGDTHLNNTSVGGKARLVDVKDFPANIIEDARKIANMAHYEITGVDAIIDVDSGQHYFLEMNSQPQLLTGAVVAEKQAMLGKYFAELLN